jgi:hypothetical protein
LLLFLSLLFLFLFLLPLVVLLLPPLPLFTGVVRPPGGRRRSFNLSSLLSSLSLSARQFGCPNFDK